MADELVVGEIETDEPIDLDVVGSDEDTPEEVDAPVEAAAEEEPAPVEAAAEPADEEPVEEPKVNLGALHEERNKRQELERKLAAQEEAFRLFQERLATQQAPVDDAAPQIPDFDEDPATNLNERLAAQEKAAAELREAQQQQTQQQEQQRQLQAFDQNFRAKEASFAAETPDYYQAIEFLRTQRSSELKGMGYQDKDIPGMVDQEAVSYALTAEQNGVDPVTMFYQTAKNRGYAAKSNGGVAPDLAKVAANQKRATAVGTSGQTSNSEVTLQDLANMSDEDFDKYTSGEAWKKYWS